jgi:hypothetical protein
MDNDLLGFGSLDEFSDDNQPSKRRMSIADRLRSDLLIDSDSDLSMSSDRGILSPVVDNSNSSQALTTPVTKRYVSNLLCLYLFILYYT